MDNHIESKNFTCHFCNKVFTKKHALKRHIDENRWKSKIINNKVNKTTKKFIFPSGKSVSYQGYEISLWMNY